jgi:hypothetical protein
MGNGVPHGLVPDVLFARAMGNIFNEAGTGRTGEGLMTEGVRDQIARTLRLFGFGLKGRARAYQTTYPEYNDTNPYPRGFRMPDFTKFNGDDSKTTYEHIGQFIA